jgi:hypothetical protein
VLCGVATALFTRTLYAQGSVFSPDVVVSGNLLIRDGHQWIAHGFYQIAFDSAPRVLNAEKAFWGIASQRSIFAPSPLRTAAMG